MLQNKTKKTDKFSYSLFCFTYPHYLRVKMTSFNAVSFSAGTYWNVSPALSGVLLYLKYCVFIFVLFVNAFSTACQNFITMYIEMSKVLHTNWNSVLVFVL